MATKATSRKAVKVVRKSGGKRTKSVDVLDAQTFDPRTHVLVPKHEKLSEKEAQAVFAKYNATLKEMPKISINDPGLRGLGVKHGDIIKISRKSYTAGTTVFYRGVIDE